MTPPNNPLKSEKEKGSGMKNYIFCDQARLLTIVVSEAIDQMNQMVDAAGTKLRGQRSN